MWKSSLKYSALECSFIFASIEQFFFYYKKSRGHILFVAIKRSGFNVMLNRKSTFRNDGRSDRVVLHKAFVDLQKCCTNI